MNKVNRRQFLNHSTLASLGLLSPSFSSKLSIEDLKKVFSNVKDGSPQKTAQNETLWENVQKAFDFNKEYINLATVVRGVASRSVSEAVIDTYKRINEFRRGGNYDKDRKETVRKQLADHVGCLPSELALTRSTTDGVTTVLKGFKLKSGEEILTTTQEHTPFYGTMEQRRVQEGIVIRRISLPTAAKTANELAEAIEQAITPKTRLIFICHVYLTGQIFPVRRVCDFAHKRGIAVLVDGALAFGHVAINIKALDCDFYAASLHKWGCGPAATGFFYVKPTYITELHPLYGYFNYESFQPVLDINKMEKFESFGTHPFALTASIGQMIDFREAIGVNNIQARLHYLKKYWTDKFTDEKTLILHTSLSEELSCSLVAFEVKGKQPDEITTPLWEKHKILMGGAYISGEFGKPSTWKEIILCNPALFTTVQELDKYSTALKQALSIS